MRNLLQLLASFTLLAAQAISPQAKLAAQIPASAGISVQRLEVSINPKLADPLVVTVPVKRTFDDDLAAARRAAQAADAARAAADAAAAAARAQAEAAARLATVPTVSTGTYVSHGIAPATPENMQALRFCEAGNIYSRNSGNGFYGAYQFDIGTWGGWGGYSRADLAPAAVQDQKFLETYSRRGWSPWPSCSRKLGFM